MQRFFFIIVLFESTVTKKGNYSHFSEHLTRFLIYFSTYGDVNGFVKFNEFDNKIDIVFLATRGNKTNIGIGGSMIKLLQQKYNHIELISANDNALKFYEHMGFTHELFQMVWRKINQNYSI